MKPEGKVNLIIEMQNKYGYNVFIETGTNYGYTLEKVHKHFKHNISIEIQKHYHDRAKEVFAGKNIDLRLGDSAVVLPMIVDKLKEPAIFWIDAHYSARDNIKPPVDEELSAIMSSNYPHVALIDDARLFDEKADTYLSEFPTVNKIIEKMSSRFDCNVDNDIIICLPKT